MNRGLFYSRLALGICALTLWLFFFCGGLLLETVEYRAFLAPHAFPNHSEVSAKAGITTKPFEGSVAFAFLAAALWFTPTNLAFLALLAGLLGGCASNILVDDLKAREQTEEISPERLRYLAEAPWSAMMRSFIVYLCVIAGLYFVIDDPFKDSTPAQYMRLAGTVSVLALLVGYDPTRIRSWMGLVPSPPSQKVTITDDQKGTVTVEAQQGPGAAQSSSSEPHESGTESLVILTSQNGDDDRLERADPVLPR